MIDISETKRIPPEPSGKPDKFEREISAMPTYWEYVPKFPCEVHNQAVDRLTRAHRAVVAKLEAQLAEALAQVPKVVKPRYWVTLSGGDIIECPVCNFRVRGTHHTHKACRCGVMFDWSEKGGEA